MGSRHRRVPPPIILICPNPPTSADGGPAGLNARKNNSHRKMLGLYLHLRRTAVHRSSTRGCLGEPTPAVHTRKTAAQRAHHLNFITETVPPTYALRCTGLHHPIYPDSKATRNKKPQVRGLTWGSPWSRLRDSNPRPTHYETVSVRAAWCLVVLLSDVLPDQSTCDWLVCARWYDVVQRRPATGWPPEGHR